MTIVDPEASPEATRAIERVTFTLPWPPSVNAAYRSVTIHGSHRMLLSKVGRAYKIAAAQSLMVQRVPRFGAARVSVEVMVYPPDKRKRDLGNLDKLAIDALMPQVIDDDSQIDRMLWERMGVVPGGRLDVTVSVISAGETP